MNDLLPFVKDKENIRVKFDETFKKTVVCYMIQADDLFVGENAAYEKECRGITFHETGEIACRTLHKFKNIGENESLQPQNIRWADVVRVMDKKDGCCDGDTLVLTVDGEKTIREICETKYSGLVFGFDHRTNKLKLTPVLSHSIKPNDNSWFEIQLENNTKIKLTGNHKVWITNKGQYTRVDELKEGDDVLLLE